MPSLPYLILLIALRTAHNPYTSKDFTVQLRERQDTQRYWPPVACMTLLILGLPIWPGRLERNFWGITHISYLVRFIPGSSG